MLRKLKPILRQESPNVKWRLTVVPGWQLAGNLFIIARRGCGNASHLGEWA